ncbi:MAG: AsmA-like C-terminal region-containing protein [Verrucomicrobiae bacterium]|nr:AsmA-like C-terminal region-containing protein [Verrucomicrobiae bacterium]
MSASPKAKGRRFWRRLRIYFRGFRIAVWLLIFVVVAALVYLNQVGLPDFLKRPLLAQIQKSGLDVDFSTLRLHWSRGFIAKQVQFGAGAITNNPALPRFTAQELEFNFHLRALLEGQVRLDSVILRQGELQWTLPATNGTPRALTISNIESSLKLQPEERWSLDDFRAQFGGVNFYAHGVVTNAPALFKHRRRTTGTGAPTPGPKPPEPGRARFDLARLEQLAELLAQIKFATPPELRVEVSGDGAKLRSFDARLIVKAPAAETPWGAGENLLLLARLSPPSGNEQSRLELSLQAGQARTEWASTVNLELELRLDTIITRPDQINSHLILRADEAESRWASVRGGQLKAGWVQHTTNPIPHQIEIEAHADRANSWLTRAADVNFAARLEPLPEPPEPAAALSYWNQLLPYQIQWAANLGRLRSVLLQADQLNVAGDWRAPSLAITNLQAQLYGGSVTSAARLNVQTREVTVQCAANFDPLTILPLLPPAAQNWLGKFTWAQAPRVQGELAVTLPAWTNAAPDWRGELGSTLWLSGQTVVTNGTYRGIRADWATTHFQFSNQVWNLPDLTVGRPEGKLQLSLEADPVTQDYYCRLRSTIDPMALLPALEPEIQRGLGFCEFGQPPTVDGELWGRWYDHSRSGFRGQIALTNVAFRGQIADVAMTKLEYTNLVVTCETPRVWSGAQYAAAEAVVADFNAQRVYFTNAFSTFAPSNIVQAIGPVVEHALAPYHFGDPPIAHVSGHAPMHDPSDAYLIFEGTGKNFSALNLQTSNYQAKVIWAGETLTVTNVVGEFYGGAAEGWAHFVFDEPDEANYAFAINTTNTHLPALVTALTQETNQLEGWLTGQLMITNANTESIKTWAGSGAAVLRDGLLWELPIFGILSEPLDALMPGVGNSKFTEARGSFSFGHGEIASADLQMRSSVMRLKYRGTVDFDGHLDARVIGEPLRDTPVVGSLVSTILSPVAYLFAYRLTGTLENPQSEPVYIPRLLLVPFSPFQTIGNLFSSEGDKSATEKFSPVPESE